MLALFSKIVQVANSPAPVFITGQTGTGKEICAETIHAQGNRAKGPFIAINCGAIPKDLLESELFGHLKGSFTGAIANRDGAASLADGGTLFLDEICELDYNLQTKLLRFLQTGYVQKIGAPAPEKLDVRIICATNKTPLNEVEQGRFREDLYYRLYVLPIHMPPLSARHGDIELIARHYLAKYATQEAKGFIDFTPDALMAINNYSWPGNIRQLQNIIRQAVVFNDGELVEADMLAIEPQSVPDLDVTCLRRAGNMPTRQLWQIERDAIEAAIIAADGSVPKAAKALGVSASTIYRKRDGWLSRAAS